MHELSFNKLVTYDAGKPGITLKVEIRLGSEAITTEAKVDTGAAVCIFQREIGERLGLEIETGTAKTIRTVTGSFKVFGHDVTLITGEFEFDSEVNFAEDLGFRQNVVGRLGWLDQMIIGINDYDGKLYLTPYNSE